MMMTAAIPDNDDFACWLHVTVHACLHISINAEDRLGWPHSISPKEPTGPSGLEVLDMINGRTDEVPTATAIPETLSNINPKTKQRNFFLT